MELNKAQKMVKMVELMSRRGGVRAGELEERFELDPRSLRRYVQDLEDISIPIQDEGRGAERTISIQPHWRRAGISLTLMELLSLHFGRKLFDFLEGTSFAGDHDGALERLEPAVQRADAAIVRQLESKFLVVPEPSKRYNGAVSDVIDELISALVYDNPIEARYRRLGGFETTYRLHPYTLASYRRGLYLFAYDVEAEQVKTFAVERFGDVLRLRRERFAYPEGWRPEAHIADAFGIISGPPEDVVLAFTEGAGIYVRERIWHPSQTFRTLPDGRLELRMRVAVTVELETWIQSFGRDVQVLAPAALVERIRASLAAALRRYG